MLLVTMKLEEKCPELIWRSPIFPDLIGSPSRSDSLKRPLEKLPERNVSRAKCDGPISPVGIAPLLTDLIENGVYPPMTLNIEFELILPLRTELSAKLVEFTLLTAVVVSFPDVTI
jgi:hypothetical protein